MFSKYLNLLLAICLLLMTGAGIGAQSNDQGVDYCAIASEADCQILEKNETLMWELSSSALTFTATAVTTESSSQGSAQTGYMELDGYLRLSLDADAMSDWSEMDAAMSLEERALILDRALASMTGELSFNMEATTSEGVDDLSINLLMDNGIFVVDGATFESLTGESMGGVEWLGLNLNGAMETLMEMPDFESTVELTNTPGIGDLEGLEKTLTITRLPDGQVNGVDVAVFNYDVDFPAMLEKLGELSMTEDMSTSDAVMLATSIRLLSDMTDGAELNIQLYVGLEDFYTRRVAMTLYMIVDADDAGFGDVGEIQIEFVMSADVSDHGQPVEVVIPEDAFVFPLAMLLTANE